MFFDNLNEVRVQLEISQKLQGLSLEVVGAYFRMQ